MDAKKNIKSEDGQALIEFVLFLPFMMMMYMTILSIGSGINGSINQQKVTRGYFYYRLSNNSMMPRPRRDGGTEPHQAWKVFGMQIMGWAKDFEGSSNTPVSPCFKFALPFDDSDEECAGTFSEQKTQFIRTETVYGVCGATYLNQNNQVIRQPYGTNPTAVISPDACSIVN